MTSKLPAQPDSAISSDPAASSTAAVYEASSFVRSVVLAISDLGNTDQVCPHIDPAAVIGDFNRICCPPLPVAIDTPNVRKAVMDCTPAFGAADPPAWFRTLFTAAAESDFLTGRSPGRPGSRRTMFVARIEWLLKPENAVKVLAGKYANWRHGAVTAIDSPYAGAF